MDNLNLTKFFTTKAQASSFSEAVSRISEKVYITDFNLESTLSNQLGVVKKDLFLQLLQQNNVSLESNSAIKKFLDNIITTIIALPTLSLTIAVEPNEQILKSVIDWCEVNLGKQVIIDVEVNPGLIAGATVQFGGKFFDFSVKPILDEILSQPPLPATEKYPHDKAHTLTNIN
jgi:hypothetical protein